MLNVIAVRRVWLFLAGVVLALGLVSAPGLVKPAEASVDYVIICNAAVSEPGVKLYVHNTVYPNGYALFPGGCVTARRTGIKVNLADAYNWRVRSNPGAYGALYASMWSYPSNNHDRFDYWLNP